MKPEDALYLGLRHLSSTKEINPKSKGQVHMVCVGVAGKEVMVGYNKYRSGKQLVYGYPGYSSVHAEFDFYRKALRKGYEPDFLIVVGERSALLSSTKPCKVCSSLLLDLGFKRIFFLEKGDMVSMSYEEFREDWSLRTQPKTDSRFLSF